MTTSRLVQYIRELHDRYGAPGFLAAYNAGPGRYERHLATGRAPPHQTLAYVATLAPIIEGKQTDEKTVTVARSFVWTSSPLFAVRTASQSSRDRSSNGLHPDRSPGDRAASIYRPLCRSRTGCSRVMSAKFDRNDLDRASSQFVVGYRVF